MNDMAFLPVIDLHCDLLHYLMSRPKATAHMPDMGASLPYLKAGKVVLQTMAVFTQTGKGSATAGNKQVKIFCNFTSDGTFAPFAPTHTLQTPTPQAILAIENMSGLCEERAPLDDAFRNFDAAHAQAKHIFYISLTHHLENRFGGGNYATTGLKRDGELFLEYLAGKRVAIDLSHTSDALARDLLDYTHKKGLDVPIIASHSNFRTLCKHARNLPEDVAKEIVRRGGLIGITLLRDYVDKTRPEHLLEHILHGFSFAADALCLGADFFYTGDMPDPTRNPFYFPEHENASKYPALFAALAAKGLSAGQLEKLAHGNALRFLNERIIGTNAPTEAL